MTIDRFIQKAKLNNIDLEYFLDINPIVEVKLVEDCLYVKHCDGTIICELI